MADEISVPRWKPLLVATLAFAVAACGSGEATETSSPAAGTPDASSEICVDAESATVDPGAARVVLVVDRTPTARTDLSTPPDLTTVITAVQQQGVESKKGSAFQTVGVTGSGEYPPLGKPSSLDLQPGQTSRAAKDLRSLLLGTCVPGWVSGDAYTPAGEGTDLFGALLAAQQQGPTQIVVISSGLNSTPVADLTVPPADAAILAEHVKSEFPDFADWAIPVTWFNLGEPNPPLSAQDRERLISFWQKLIGEENLDVNTREGAPGS
jgi:hypothetical protein